MKKYFLNKNHESLENVYTLFLSDKKGITLITLVVTIIVLVILAGVTIGLVSGSDGILSRSSSAVDIHQIETAKESVVVKIGEYNAEYYHKMYLTMEEVIEENPGDYIYNKYGGANKKIETGGYKFTITIPEGEETASEAKPYDVKIEDDKKFKKAITGKLTIKGVLTWDEEVIETEYNYNNELACEIELSQVNFNTKARIISSDIKDELNYSKCKYVFTNNTDKIRIR